MKIKEITDKTTIYFPKNVTETSHDHLLTFYSELTGESIEFDVTDESTYRKYYVFTIDLTGLDKGEYVYTIDTTAKGLIIVGDIHSTIDRVEYEQTSTDDENEKKYIFYED